MSPTENMYSVQGYVEGIAILTADTDNLKRC